LELLVLLFFQLAKTIIPSGLWSTEGPSSDDNLRVLEAVLLMPALERLKLGKAAQRKQQPFFQRWLQVLYGHGSLAIKVQKFLKGRT
jgi:hypothetical protein